MSNRWGGVHCPPQPVTIIDYEFESYSYNLIELLKTHVFNYL